MIENNNQEKKIKRRKIIINIIALIIFLTVCILVTIWMSPYIKEFTNDPRAFRDYIKENGFLGVLLFLTIQILQVIVSTIPGEFVEIAAGITFGWFFGLVLCEIGILIATVLIFMVCKKLGKPLIDNYVGKGKLKKFDQLDKSPKRDRVLFFLFLIPGIPKDMLIYASAFFDISLSKFLLISLIARIPSIITSTIAGDYILEKKYGEAILIFVITGVITIICYLLYDKIYKRVTTKENKNEK